MRAMDAEEYRRIHKQYAAMCSLLRKIRLIAEADNSTPDEIDLYRRAKKKMRREASKYTLARNEFKKTAAS